MGNAGDCLCPDSGWGADRRTDGGHPAGGNRDALLWIWLAVTDPAALRIPRADLPVFTLLGLIAVTIFYPALFYTYAWTGVAIGTILLYLSPALVTVGAALFLREPLTRRKLVALVATFLGSALVVQLSQAGKPPGRRRRDRSGADRGGELRHVQRAGEATPGAHRIATVLAAYLMLGTLLLIGVKLLVSPATWPSPRDAITIGLLTGVLATLLPITLYTYGLSRLPASDASILLTFEPVVALILAAGVLGESLALGQWLGASSVLAGVVLLTWPRRTVKKRLASAQLSTGATAHDVPPAV